MALTYSLKDDANGALVLVDNTIRAAVALNRNSYAYTVVATDGNGWTKEFYGTITVSLLPGSLSLRTSSPLPLVLLF